MRFFTRTFLIILSLCFRSVSSSEEGRDGQSLSPGRFTKTGLLYSASSASHSSSQWSVAHTHCTHSGCRLDSMTYGMEASVHLIYNHQTMTTSTYSNVVGTWFYHITVTLTCLTCRSWDHLQHLHVTYCRNLLNLGRFSV